MKKTILTLTAAILSLSCLAVAGDQNYYRSSGKSKPDIAVIKHLHDQLHRAMDAKEDISGSVDEPKLTPQEERYMWEPVL